MDLRGYLISAVLLALLGMILPSSLTRRLIGTADIDQTTLVRWANHSALNNQNCVVSQVADSCEDVAIHYATNTAFLACGNGKERTQWYPGAGMRSAKRRSEASFREFLFKYDIRSGETTELKIEGLDGDFVTHGLDIFQLPNVKTKVSWQIYCFHNTVLL
jgi:arylesterase/paraoxonase